MGYYTPNPHDQPESPRCPECDQQMELVTSTIFPAYWECDNPECTECSPRHKRESGQGALEFIVSVFLLTLVMGIPMIPGIIRAMLIGY